jgi:uncharacterized delta-60 repeat protein
MPEEAYSDETFSSDLVLQVGSTGGSSRVKPDASRIQNAIPDNRVNSSLTAQVLVTLTAYLDAACTQAAPGSLLATENPVTVASDGKATFQGLRYDWPVAGLEGNIYLKATASSGESVCITSGIRILRRLSDIPGISSGAITLAPGGTGAAGAPDASRTDSWSALAIDSLGRILTVGSHLNAVSLNRMVLARYLPNGTLDSTFNSSGLVVFDPSRPWVTAVSEAQQEYGTSLLIDSVNFPDDPRIVVLGRLYTPTLLYRLVVWRFKGDGTLDSSFGSGSGYVVLGNNLSTALAGGSGSYRSDYATTLRVTPEGRYLVVGYGYNAGNSISPFLARLMPDGSFDTTLNAQSGRSGWAVFGNDLGKVGFTGSYPGTEYFSAIEPDTNGNVILAGYSTNPYGNQETFVLKIRPDGSLDPTFGPGASGSIPPGVALLRNGLPSPTMALIETKSDVPHALFRESSGKLLIAGYSRAQSGALEPVLWRLNSDGTLDTTFQGKGYTVFHAGQPAVTGRPAHLKTELFRRIIGPDSSGRYLIIGTSKNAAGSLAGGTDLVIWRYLSDGTLDTSFRGKGYQVLREGLTASGGAVINNEAINGAAQSGASSRVWLAGSSQNASGRTVPTLWRISPTGLSDSTPQQSPPRLTLRLLGEDAAVDLAQGGCEPLELRAVGDISSSLLGASEMATTLSASDSDASTFFSESTCTTPLSPVKTITLLKSQNFTLRFYVRLGSNPSLTLTASGPTGVQSSTASLSSIGATPSGSPTGPIYALNGETLFNGTTDKVLSAMTKTDPAVSSSMSWSFWVKPSRGNSDYVKHLFGGAVVTESSGNISAMIQRGRYLTLQWIGDSPRFFVNTKYPTPATWQAAGAELETWQHIAVVFTPTRLIFYKNGVRSIYAGTPSFAATSDTHLVAGYWYGNNKDANNTAFKGSMGDIKVYDRALSEAEVLALFGQDRAAYAVPAVAASAVPVLSLSLPAGANSHLNLSGACRAIQLQGSHPSPLGLPELLQAASPMSVSLTSSLAGSFYRDASCAQSISSLEFATGDLLIGNFYFKASTPGTASLSASFSGFSPLPLILKFADAAAGPVLHLDAEKANGGTAPYSPGCTGLNTSGTAGNRWYDLATSTSLSMAADSRWTNHCYQGTGTGSDPYRYEFMPWNIAGSGYSADGCTGPPCYIGKPYIATSIVPDLSMSDTFTYEVWVKPTQDANNRTIFTNYTGTTLYVQPNPADSSKMRFTLGLRISGVNTSLHFDAAQAGFGQWTHVVAMISRQRAILTVNGTVTEVRDLRTGMTNLSGILIGIHIDAAHTSFYSGALALFRIYERALTAQEVLDHFNATKARFGF